MRPGALNIISSQLTRRHEPVAGDTAQLPGFKTDDTSNNDDTPSTAWDLDATKRTLDELFTLTYQYKTSQSYLELIQFVSRFRKYSPFNAMLVHIQMPGAVYVAPAHRWLRSGRIATGEREPFETEGKDVEQDQGEQIVGNRSKGQHRGGKPFEPFR